MNKRQMIGKIDFQRKKEMREMRNVMNKDLDRLAAPRIYKCSPELAIGG